MDKVKLNRFKKKYINTDNIKIIILFIPLLLIFIRQCKKGEFSSDDFLDTSILISFVFVFICELLAKWISDLIDRYCEDAVKLTEDYAKLTEQYCRENLLTCPSKENNGGVVKIPAIVFCQRRISDEPYKFDIHNIQKQYNLPKQVADNSDWLMEAHEHSERHNNINIRLDDIKQTDNHVKLICSKTAYFDSLITNRAMDYQLKNGKTVREIYEPGPFVSLLSESKLSNHLGFNGFVETSDNKLIFVWRSDKVSIGKNTLATSIGASLKAKYGLNADRELTTEGLRTAIRMEIEDELKIKIDKNIPLEKTIFAFYRDLVEGGKPQFLFYYHLEKVDVRDFENGFNKYLEKEGKKKLVNSGTVDGTKFYYFTRQQLSNSTVSAGQIEIENQKFKIMPSVAASVILLLKNVLELPDYR